MMHSFDGGLGGEVDGESLDNRYHYAGAHNYHQFGGGDDGSGALDPNDSVMMDAADEGTGEGGGPAIDYEAEYGLLDQIDLNGPSPPADVAALTRELQQLREEKMRLGKELDRTRAQLSVALGEEMRPISPAEAGAAAEAQPEAVVVEVEEEEENEHDNDDGGPATAEDHGSAQMEEEEVVVGLQATQPIIPPPPPASAAARGRRRVEDVEEVRSSSMPATDGGFAAILGAAQGVQGVQFASASSVSPRPDRVRLTVAGGDAREQRQADMVAEGFQAVLDEGARNWGSMENYQRQLTRHVKKFPKFGRELTLANQRRLDAEMRLSSAVISLDEAKEAKGKLVARAVSAERALQALQQQLAGGGGGEGAQPPPSCASVAARLEQAEATVASMRAAMRQLQRSRDEAVRELDTLKAEVNDYMGQYDAVAVLHEEMVEGFRCVVVVVWMTGCGDAVSTEWIVARSTLAAKDKKAEEQEEEIRRLQSMVEELQVSSSNDNGLRASLAEAILERVNAKESVATMQAERDAAVASFAALQRDHAVTTTTLQRDHAATIASLQRERDAALAALASAESDTAAIVRQKEQMHALALTRLQAELDRANAVRGAEPEEERPREAGRGGGGVSVPRVASRGRRGGH
jgi:phosphotransferase system HPr-like phosphotransfer protein